MRISEIIRSMSKQSKIISIIIISILLLLLVVFLSYYFWYSLPLEPEVDVVDYTYNASTIGRDYNTERPIFKEFEEEYGGDYSPDLRRRIIDNMKSQAASLGEDPEILERCIYVNLRLKDDDYHAIPCLAVKARFEYYEDYPGQNPNPDDYPPGFDFGPKVSEPCWIFLINWGAAYEDFGHFCLYAVSIKTYEQLYYVSCM